MADSKKRKFHSPTKPHFFQPLLHDFLTNFLIPKSFHKHIGPGENDYDGSENIATLRDKTKKIWYVKIVNGDDGRKQLKDGWKEFCNDHNLKAGDFLVFRHKGNLDFDVLIFDSSACEQVVVPIVDDNDYLLAKKNRYEEKKMDDERRHIKRKSAFKPSGFPYFHTIVKPFNLKSGRLNIPMEFAGSNGINKRWCKMVLIDEKGRSWPILLRHRRNRTHGEAYIGPWRNVLRAHGLNTGDHLIFELIDSGINPIMKFYACDRKGPVLGSKSRIQNFSVDHPERGIDKKNVKGLKKAESYQAARSTRKNVFKPKGYPYCRTSVNSYSYNFGGMIIPIEFARKNGLDDRGCDMVLINEEGQQWKLTLRHYKSRSTVYIGHWKTFHKANALKAGDRVVFELIDSGENPVMKFYNCS